MPGVCPRCEKNVYFAEEVKALGNVYHKLCFSCSNCRKLLNPGSITEHDGQMFCKNCYGYVGEPSSIDIIVISIHNTNFRKKFGPKGYGFGGGAAGLSKDDGACYKTNPNEVDHKAKAYVAPIAKKPLVPSNSSTNIIENGGGAPVPVKKISASTSNGVKVKPKWGGAEVS